MNKERKWVVTLLIALLLINIYQNVRISQIKNDLGNQRNSFQAINEDINQIDQNVNNTLNEWERENKWVRYSGYKVKSVSDDLENMTISVFWDFNSLKNDEKVYLNVAKFDNDNLVATPMEKFEVEPVYDLHYEKELTMPLRANYGIEVIAEDENEKRTEELSRIDIYAMLVSRIQMHGGISKNANDISLYIDVANSNIGLDFFNEGKLMKAMPEQLKIEKAVLEVYIKGKLFETVDLLKDGSLENSNEDFEMINYNKTFEDNDFEVNDLKVIVKIQDNLGIEYEKEIELNR